MARFGPGAPRIENMDYDLGPLADPENSSRGYMLEPSAGPRVWFMKGMIAWKARKLDTDGLFSASEWLFPADFFVPPHHHEHEAEAFYILEGKLEFTVGDKTYTAVPGAFVYVPPMTVHSIRGLSESSKLLLIISPGGYEHYFEELGEPAEWYGVPGNEGLERLPTPAEMVELGIGYGWRPGPPEGS